MQTWDCYNLSAPGMFVLTLKKKTNNKISYSNAIFQSIHGFKDGSKFINTPTPKCYMKITKKKSHNFY